jgi:ABC-type molybdate transport system permease subunit
VFFSRLMGLECLLRRVIRVILGLPFVICPFIIGWTLIWIDSKKRPKNLRVSQTLTDTPESLSFELSPESTGEVVLEDT